MPDCNITINVNDDTQGSVPVAYSLLSSSGGALTIHEPPMEATEPVQSGSYPARRLIDLSGATSMRLAVLSQQAREGTPAITLHAQYSDDDGATWSYADGAAVVVPADESKTAASPWVDLAPAARGDRVWRVVTTGGDDTGDVYLMAIDLHVR